MIQPIAVLYYNHEWKEPDHIEVMEFNIEQGRISSKELDRWRRVQSQGKTKYQFVGWCNADQLPQADAAIAYWKECER